MDALGLKRVRKARGLKQIELARMLGKPWKEKTLSDLETFRSSLEDGSYELSQLVKALDSTANEILGLDILELQEK